MNIILRIARISLTVLLTAAIAFGSGAGSLDLSFNGSGYRVDTYGGQPVLEGAFRTVVQADGKILIGVRSFSTGRYNADGTTDLSFGTGGKIVTPFSPYLTRHSFDMGLLPDGKSMMVGYAEVPVPEVRQLWQVRRNVDGSADSGFGSVGVVGTFVNDLSSHPMRMAVQSDGKVVIVANLFHPVTISGPTVIVRYNVNGTLDNSFDGDGVATLSTALDLYPRGLAIQPDGKILVGGGSSGVTPIRFAMARYNSDGSIDNSFDSDGVVHTQIADGAGSRIADLKLLPDGRILAGGYSNATQNDFALARYNADGSLDTSLDGDGKLLTVVTPGSDTIMEMAIQTDGKFVVTGATGGNDLTVVRYNVDGSLDAAYGDGGIATVDLGGVEWLSTLALDSSGSAVVAGTASGSTLIARFTAEQAPIVSLSGRITNATGRGLAGIYLTLTNDDDEVLGYTLTNGFGYYTFPSISSNEIYTVYASSKRYNFTPGARTVTVLGAVSDIDFIGTAEESRR